MPGDPIPGKEPPARVRTRLSPDARKKQLLASARQMIVDDGLQSFTMEALARAAGVTTPLVYNYFSGRHALLQALLVEEYATYTQKLNAEVEAASSFEDIVRVYIAANFDHHAPGNILPILQSQPDIASAIAESRTGQIRRAARILVRNAAKEYKLSRSRAELAASMSSGASIAAAEYAARTGVDRDKTINSVLAYVLTGMEALGGE